MDIIAQLTEYKTKIETLAGKAAQAENAIAEVESLKAEKESFAGALVAKETALQEATDKVTALEAEVIALKADIDAREANKKASDERALEIVASLGLKEIPVITITETDKPTAESIRNKYLSLTGKEKAVFFKENQKALISGIVD